MTPLRMNETFLLYGKDLLSLNDPNFQNMVITWRWQCTDRSCIAPVSSLFFFLNWPEQSHAGSDLSSLLVYLFCKKLRALLKRPLPPFFNSGLEITPNFFDLTESPTGGLKDPFICLYHYYILVCHRIKGGIPVTVYYVPTPHPIRYFHVLKAYPRPRWEYRLSDCVEFSQEKSG